MFGYFLQGFILGFPAAATPGPLQAYFLSQTMRSGWKKTLPSALAPLISDGPIIFLVLFVLTRTPDYFLRGLRVAGGLFILYLAYSAFVQLRRRPTSQPEVSDASHKGLLRAAFTNLLNPNPYIFWGVVAGPILIAAWRESSVFGLGFMIGFYGTMISSFGLLIVFFGLAGRLSLRMTYLLSGLSAIALLLFGLYQLWTGIVG
jgi:threonine/homoserine/homoserine lactone efflux protein